MLGADEPIDDLETFAQDSLYLQLFEVIFPNYNFEEVEPGNSPDEMAQNIDGLLQLLGGQVLDMDLSFIDAAKVVGKDLKHMQNFLQLLMDVVLLIAEKQEEEEEEAEQDPKAALKQQLDKPEEAKKGDKAAQPPDAEDETDTQKLANDLGLEMGDEEASPGEAQLAMPDEDEPQKPNLDDDHDARGHFAPLDLGEPESASKPKKEASSKKKENKPAPEPIDVFNDPLIPEDVNPHKGSGQKRGRSGSFGGDDKGGFDDEMDVAYDDLNDEEKQYLLEQLWEEYQRDPDNFPEEQRQLLEQEIHKFIDPNQFGDEDDLEDEMDDERMKIEGNINFPKEPLPMRQGDDDDTSPQLEIDDGPLDEKDDDERYLKELAEQQDKAKKAREQEERELRDQHQDPDEHEEEEPDHSPLPGPDDQPEQEADDLYYQDPNDAHDQQEPGEEEDANIPEDEEEAPQFEEDQLAQLEHQRMLMQQMAMQNQYGAPRGRKKRRGKKKRMRPSTAKQGWGYPQVMANSASGRPMSASTRKKRRSRKRRSSANKRKQAEEMYMQQLQNQALMQQWALQQQEAAAARGEPPLTDEQLYELQQQMLAQQQMEAQMAGGR